MVGELTSGIPASLYDSSAPLWIGVQNVTTSATRYFPGQIDEVAIYNQALSAQQIADHYAAALTPAANPVSTGNLKAWYQIDNGVRLAYESSDDTYRAVAWQDSSGNGRIMEQATVASTPVMQQNQVGGYPALEFDGSNDWLSAGDVDCHSNSEGMTVLAVARRDGADRNRAIAAQYSTSTGQREWTITGGMFTVQENPASYNSAMAASFGSVDNDWHIYSGLWKPGVSTQAYLDGLLTGTAPTVTSTMTDTGVALTLGAYPGGTQYQWDGMIAEVLVFDRALTESEHHRLGWYLAQKYGLETAFIPEPSTALLLLFGAGFLLLPARQRRASR